MVYLLIIQLYQIIPWNTSFNQLDVQSFSYSYVSQKQTFETYYLLVIQMIRMIPWDTSADLRCGLTFSYSNGPYDSMR